MILTGLLIVWIASALVMAAAWWVCRRIGNAGYVDVVWAGLMAAAALFAGAFGDGAALPRGLVAMMGSLWGARLCLHLLHRVLHEPEDGRYRFLREHWQGNQRYFFVFFQAQAVFVAIFALPMLVAAGNPERDFTVWTALALAIWALAVGGEALADRQLARFRANPANRGEVCRDGLWGWSRHPNYFFEWLHWFAYVLLAIGAPQWWLSLAGPLLMLLFLYRFTGIPWTEQQALRSRGEAYRRYQREVSPFIPWPPRRPRN
ncbi:DUF1295 domain-containing protein [Rehaibacterium terrae]|jgi:steroid 5-alpha reductase family enzyme|uniref:Steroid 5-alpha reductase family enzyme n=1 Tax=Rehaibacterium terrae TaxID=1341696 RepID=A0A7W7Y0H7_9GAMM|nr:DUF1295 domain-containing protein [Rehaibacterium terrae]MBB5015831.1 steroid 5-alpha reductase family enzyme [Rehaibacterium terrae]